MEALQLAIVIALGFAAGTLGALLGLGGGIFLVPALTWIFGLPVRQAAGVGLMTVIATSGAVSSETCRHGFVNTRLGMLLLVGSSIGGLTGGLTAQYVSEATVALIFAITTAAIAAVGAAEPRPRQCRRRRQHRAERAMAAASTIRTAAARSSTTWSGCRSRSRRPSSPATSRACSAWVAACSRCRR